MADKVNAPIAKLVGDKLDPKIVAGAEAGLGALLVFSKGKKSLLKSLAGGLLLGAGVKSLMASFGMGGIGPYGNVPVVGAIGPYGRVPVVGRRRVNGYSPNGSLNGYTPNGSLSSVKNVVGNAVPSEGGSGITSGQGSNMMN